ncbi:hypothetical protein E4U36_007893, partial [Claviceps purpurea]
IRQALRDHLEAHGFVSKRSYSSVSLINYVDWFSNISTKTPSPRTPLAKKNSLPIHLKNLSIPLSIALPITSMTTKQTPLMKILLTSPLNAQLKPDIADKDTANFDDKLTTTTPTSLTNLKKEKSLPRTPMTTEPPALFRPNLTIKKRTRHWDLPMLRSDLLALFWSSSLQQGRKEVSTKRIAKEFTTTLMALCFQTVPHEPVTVLLDQGRHYHCLLRKTTLTAS